MASSAVKSVLPTFTKISKSIRLHRQGCTNRPFYHIVVMDKRDMQDGPVVEQLGTYDPLPNIDNQKLVAVNFERMQHWIASGADLTDPVAELLGLSGFLPMHYKTYIKAWRNRAGEKEQPIGSVEESEEENKSRPPLCKALFYGGPSPFVRVFQNSEYIVLNLPSQFVELPPPKLYKL
nr:EOG090X0KAD [Triops cancriformis]